MTSTAAKGARHPLVAVYADESCLGNGREGDNPGGAGALVEYMRPQGDEIVRRDLWVSEPGTTNDPESGPVTSTSLKGFCHACWSGEYPVAIPRTVLHRLRLIHG